MSRNRRQNGPLVMRKRTKKMNAAKLKASKLKSTKKLTLLI